MQDAWKLWPQVVTPHCVALLAYAIWVPVGTKRSRNKGHILKVCGCPDMPWKRLRCLVPRVSIRSTFSSRILTTLLWAELVHISRWGIKFGDPFARWELQRKKCQNQNGGMWNQSPHCSRPHARWSLQQSFHAAIFQLHRGGEIIFSFWFTTNFVQIIGKHARERLWNVDRNFWNSI